MTQLDIAPYRNQMPTELQGDLVLPDDIRPHGRPDTSTGSILVTGATGFLGSAVLAEALAECPDTHVYCLIRSAEDNAAIRLRTYRTTFACGTSLGQDGSRQSWEISGTPVLG